MLMNHQKTANKKQINTILIILCILLFKIDLFSQSLEKIKESDTIYIFMDLNKKYSIRDKNFNKDSEYEKNRITYIFSIDHYNTVMFTSNTYKDRDSYREGIKNDERMEKKSFLKENKDIILDIDFFITNGFKKTFVMLYKKTIYLIDKDEIKGRKIKVKQVRMSCLTCFEE